TDADRRRGEIVGPRVRQRETEVAMRVYQAVSREVEQYALRSAFDFDQGVFECRQDGFAVLAGGKLDRDTPVADFLLREGRPNGSSIIPRTLEGRKISVCVCGDQDEPSIPADHGFGGHPADDMVG